MGATFLAAAFLAACCQLRRELQQVFHAGLHVFVIDQQVLFCHLLPQSKVPTHTRQSILDEAVQPLASACCSSFNVRPWASFQLNRPLVQPPSTMSDAAEGAEKT